MQLDSWGWRVERAALLPQPPMKCEVKWDNGVFLQYQSERNLHRAVGHQAAIAAEKLDGGRRTLKCCSRNESLRREDQTVKPLRAGGDGVGGAQRRSGGGGGAAQVGPVA